MERVRAEGYAVVAGVVSRFGAKHGGNSQPVRDEDYGGYVRYSFSTGDGMACRLDVHSDYYQCFDVNNRYLTYPSGYGAALRNAFFGVFKRAKSR